MSCCTKNDPKPTVPEDPEVVHQVAQGEVVDPPQAREPASQGATHEDPERVLLRISL